MLKLSNQEILYDLCCWMHLQTHRIWSLKGYRTSLFLLSLFRNNLQVIHYLYRVRRCLSDLIYWVRLSYRRDYCVEIYVATWMLHLSLNKYTSVVLVDTCKFGDHMARSSHSVNTAACMTNQVEIIWSPMCIIQNVLEYYYMSYHHSTRSDGVE